MITKIQKKELNALIHEILELRDKRCLRCGNLNLQASHIYPKGRYRKMEFEPSNIISLCFGCHIGFWHKNPREANEWVESKLPKQWLDKLKLMAQSGAGTREFKLLKIALTKELEKYAERSLS